MGSPTTASAALVEWNNSGTFGAVDLDNPGTDDPAFLATLPVHLLDGGTFDIRFRVDIEAPNGCGSTGRGFDWIEPLGGSIDGHAYAGAASGVEVGGFDSFSCDSSTPLTIVSSCARAYSVPRRRRALARAEAAEPIAVVDDEARAAHAALRHAGEQVLRADDCRKRLAGSAAFHLFCTLA